MARWKIVLVVLLVLGFVAGIMGWRWVGRIMGPGPTDDQGPRILLVPSGASFDQVVDSLKADGLLEDEQAFRWLAGYKKYDQRVRPGRYVIAPGASLNELVNKLRSGEQDPVRVTFNNIKGLPQLAGQVARYLEPDSASLIKAFRDPATVQRLGFKPETMISLFVPNTYEFWWTTTPEGFLERMAKEYKTFWTADRKAQAQQLGLSQGEVSTLASIVQAETGRMGDAPIIAGVYLNRLRIGMPLQADPTLKFALGIDSVNRVLDRDKLVGSPYNTYLNKGLPPGPINMPEARFIEAVLVPRQHDYLYFCAREDLSGYSNFARTYDQHLVNARRYQKALNARGIYR